MTSKMVRATEDIPAGSPVRISAITSLGPDVEVVASDSAEVHGVVPRAIVEGRRGWMFTGELVDALVADGVAVANGDPVTDHASGLFGKTGDTIFGTWLDVKDADGIAPAWFDDLASIGQAAAAGSGLPDDVYMDSCGNFIKGAANIATFALVDNATCRIKNCDIDSTATIVWPDDPVEVDGLKAYGDCTVDMSAMQSGYVRDVIVMGHYPVTLGNDSGVSALNLRDCIFQQGALNSEGDITILSGGSYRSIHVRSGSTLEVQAGLSGVFILDDTELHGGYLVISGNANVTCENLLAMGDADLYFESDTSPTVISDVIVAADGDIENSSGGTGALRIDYPTSIVGRAQHRTSSGTGRTIVGGNYNTERFAGVIAVEHSGVANGDLVVDGRGEVDVSGTHAAITITGLDGAEIRVDDAAAVPAPIIIYGVSGPGKVLIEDSTGGVEVGGVRLEYAAVVTITADSAAAGITSSAIGQGAQIAIPGGSAVTELVAAPGVTLDCNGHDVQNVQILDSDYSGTLSGANTNTYKGFGADTLVD